MKLPSPPVFRPEDFPEMDAKFLSVLSAGFRDVFNALVSAPTFTFREGLTFTTGGSGTAYLDVSMESQPKHLWVTRLEAIETEELATAYSQTWVRLNGKARCLFAGLTASTKYRCAVASV